jgi:hypothetical protein
LVAHVSNNGITELFYLYPNRGFEIDRGNEMGAVPASPTLAGCDDTVINPDCSVVAQETSKTQKNGMTQRMFITSLGGV